MIWHAGYISDPVRSAASHSLNTRTFSCNVLNITTITAPTAPTAAATGKAILVRAWTGPYGSRSLRLSGVPHNRHMKVARLSAVRTGRLYHQEVSLALISAKGRVDPRDIVRPEGVDPALLLEIIIIIIIIIQTTKGPDILAHLLPDKLVRTGNYFNQT